MKNVKVEVESYMHFGIARQLSRNFREKIVSQIYKEVEPKADWYWEEYAKYLVSQGWRKTTQKRQLKQHCEWLVRGLVCGDKQDVIATSEGKRTTQQAVSVAVNRIAKAIELPLG